MTLKDGKFYEGDKVVPLEFGNKDQIKLMSKAKELMGDGILVYITETFSLNSDETFKISFTCICGCRYEKELSSQLWESFTKESYDCRGCKMKYMLDGTQRDQFITVKTRKEHVI